MSETPAVRVNLINARITPVTNPVRVMVVDADIVSGTALSHAIDMDRDLAVVGLCRNLRRVRSEADRCKPDLVAIRLGLDDERCASVLATLAAGSNKPCVVVLGPTGAIDSALDAGVMKARIRAVAQASLGLAADEAAPANLPSGVRLN